MCPRWACHGLKKAFEHITHAIKYYNCSTLPDTLVLSFCLHSPLTRLLVVSYASSRTRFRYPLNHPPTLETELMASVYRIATMAECITLAFYITNIKWLDITKLPSNYNQVERISITCLSRAKHGWTERPIHIHIPGHP